MRNIPWKATFLTALLLMCRYSAAAPAPQQADGNMNSMTTAELEKAGDLARIHKDYELAISYFQAALRHDRSNPVLYNKLGLAQMRTNDLASARDNFQKAAKRDSKYADAINNMGAVDFMNHNYGSAAKYFRKAVALDETRSTFHVNLGAAWFSQKKFEQAIAEYTRAMELDPDVFHQEARAGVVAQISSPEERAQYSYLLAKIYAKRGDVEDCLQCLRKAKEDGYRNLGNVYKDEEFSRLRDNPRLQDVVPPPTAR